MPSLSSQKDVPLLPPQQFGPQEAARRREHLLAEIAVPPRQRRGRALIAAAALGLAVTAVGGTAAAWSRFGQPADPTSAVCSPVDHLLPGYATSGSFVGTVAPVGGKAPAVDAVQACAALWRAGIVHAPDSPPQPVMSNAAPHLTACVTEDRVLVVFPSDAGVCNRLGLQLPVRG